MLRVEIFDEHDVDEGLVEETNDHGAAVGRNAESGRAVVGLRGRTSVEKDGSLKKE